MHPYWIQKIEESRKTSVTKFWVTIVLIIVIPLLLVMKHDHFMILGVLCFVGAGLRYYWLGRETQLAPKDQLPASADLTHQAEMSVSPQWQSNTNPFGAPLPAVPTHPDFAGSQAVSHAHVGANSLAESAQVVAGPSIPGLEPQLAGSVPTQFPNGLPPSPFPHPDHPDQTVPAGLAEQPAPIAAHDAQNAASAHHKPLHFHDMAR
jgi:hypothetical protein